MKMLILGGTIFLGRHLVEAARARGHEVTLFNRGLHDPALFPDVERLRGDRGGDLAALRGRHWDAAIDTNGYVPSKVCATARVLADTVRHYTFISSVSVYADLSTPDVDEEAPVSTLTPEQVQAAEEIEPPRLGTVAMAYGEHYGALKALCERKLTEMLPGRVLHVRPGLIVGPYDYSDRFTYWPQRVARGGEVLAPGRPERGVQLIDARDLAAWIIRMGEVGQTGTYNATGPDHLLTMQRVLETCRSVTNSNAMFTWLDDAFLLSNGAAPWGQVPLWIPDDAGMPGFLAMSTARARAAGLTFRPLAETVRDTLAWDDTRPSNSEREAGLSADQEAHLLHGWHEQHG
ncbi:MAG: SDR family oxidoreductase [Ktedonobacteraceae bacterium]